MSTSHRVRHGLVAALSLIAVALLGGCGGDDDGEGGDAGARWAGTFDSTFGELTLTSDGDQVTGTYELCEGTLEGTATDSTLAGEWAENPDACPEALRGSGAEFTGPFEFTLSEDGDSFEGTWEYASGNTDPQGDTWEGTRTSGGVDGEETAEEPSETSHEISVVYEPPRNPTERLAAKLIRVGGTEGVAEGFSQNFELPVDLVIHATRGDYSPYYDPRDHTINLSYGFVDQTARILQAGGVVANQRDLGTQLASIDSFILIHELGHAFVDLFDLPITGREEDAVDGMATVFFTDSVPKGPEYAFYAARFFALLQDVQGKPSPAQFQDEHSLSIQRFYDIVCAIAGSSQETMRDVARLGILDRSRLVRCPAEYEQKSSAWKTLLEPYLAEGS